MSNRRNENEISRKRSIKKNVFLPSETVIWEMASSKIEKSYFIELKRYCSCKGFYYNKSRQHCYHLVEVERAISDTNYIIEIHQDKDRDKFIKKLVWNIFN